MDWKEHLDLLPNDCTEQRMHLLLDTLRYTLRSDTACTIAQHLTDQCHAGRPKEFKTGKADDKPLSEAPKRSLACNICSHSSGTVAEQRAQFALCAARRKQALPASTCHLTELRVAVRLAMRDAVEAAHNELPGQAEQCSRQYEGAQATPPRQPHCVRHRQQPAHATGQVSTLQLRVRLCSQNVQAHWQLPVNSTTIHAVCAKRSGSLTRCP